MEAHAVLGGDEIEPPLRVTLELARSGEQIGSRAARFRIADRIEQSDQRLASGRRRLRAPGCRG
jgi:hypothetical protein